jgi:hypothetical protein
MNKATFKYTKPDGTSKFRVIIRPSLLKEATNSLKDFDNPNVNYVNGYEIDSTLSASDVIKYEKLIEEYFTTEPLTLEQFITNKGFDPKKVQQKSFKKSGITDLNFI